jgi:hypothetical protein
MMDTDSSLLLALIFLVALIIFDIVFFQFRKEYDQNEPEISMIQDGLRRLKEWVESRKKPNSGLFTQNIETPKTAAELSNVEPAVSAEVGQVLISHSSPSVNKKASTERPSVHIQFSADIPEGTIVHIRMEVVDGEGKVSVQQETLSSQATTRSPLRSEHMPSFSMPNLRPWVEAQINKIKSSTPSLDGNLFWAAIIIYGLMVSIGIDRFPIYFFTDEAIHMNMIADFVNHGFKNYYNEFLPTFFSTEGWVNGTSVYVQLIPYLLFGKSVVVTRLVSAFITLLGAAAVGLMLKKAFKIKYYWAGIFLLITTPAWFLHARTAFEYAEVASFYCIFLYFYSRYRRGDLRSLYIAVFAGALCFYTHGLGEILMGVTGLALLIVDFRFHIHPRQRKTVLLGFGLAIILLLPFVRYYLAHPNETAEQVKRRGSYWADSSLTSIEKIQNFLVQYTYGLNPIYWYFPNNVDIDRHRMLGFWYGNGLWLTLPLEIVGLFQILKSIRNRFYQFAIILLLACPILPSSIMIGLQGNKTLEIGSAFSITFETLTMVLWFSVALMLLGVFLALKNIRVPAHRLALIALLACPIPASVVAIGMPRMLWMAVPLAILSTIGISAVIEWIEKSLHRNSTVWSAWILFAALTSLSIFILGDALINGPLWFQDYTLYGMQYGAPQVFHDIVLPELESDSNMHIIVSPSWANGTEQFISFFIPKDYQPRVTFGQPIDSMDNPAIFTSDTLFITTANEYNNLTQDAKFTDINIRQTIPYPNQEPGFYLLSLRPADNFAQIIAAQHELNRKPIEDTMQFNNETINVLHSPLSSGRIEDIFDNNPDTLARVLEANPFVIDLEHLPTPIEAHSVFFKTGSTHNFTITFHLYAPGASEPIEYSQTYQDLPGKDLPPDPEFTMSFDKGPEKAERIEIEVKDNGSGETSQFHLRTIEFK